MCANNKYRLEIEAEIYEAMQNEESINIVSSGIVASEVDEDDTELPF